MGLDRFMILKFLRMGLFLFFGFSLLAIPILFPVNIINQGDAFGLNRYTIGNVIDDNRTWAHCLLAIILFVSTMAYTYRGTLNFIHLRREYLLSPSYASTITARTIYVPSIPEEINHPAELTRIFSKYPGGVRRIWINRHLDDLPKLVAERENAVYSLETAVTKAILSSYKDAYKKKKASRVDVDGQVESQSGIPEKLRPTHRESSFPISLPCVGHKVDSIEFYMNKIKNLNESIDERQQQQVESTNFKPINSAFIEFNHQIAAHMAAQCLTDGRAMKMAPRAIQVAPSDVIWENLRIHSFERLIRKFVSIIITCAIVIFWAIPVVFVQFLANLKTLSEIFPPLSAINELGPAVVGIIQGILPAAALAILVSLVPTVFSYLTKNEGIPQKSFVELSVLHKFFFFQFVDVVLVSTISGGIANILSLVQNPLDIITTLSEKLPQTSTFFITFVMLQATSQSGQAMLQIIPLLFSFLNPFFATTPRDLYNQKHLCPSVYIGTLIPGHTIIFVLGLEYAVISPLILPFIILYFALQYFVMLYQFLYVYELDFETGGRAYPKAIRHVYVGLFTSELTLIGLFAIRKNARGQLVLMVITFIVTIFVLAYYERAYQPLFKYLPISLLDSDDPALTRTIKMERRPTYSSVHSKTPIEAYHARQILLDRLETTRVISDNKLDLDNSMVVSTLKSLYATQAYMHPSTYSNAPTVWLPEDDLNITQSKIKEARAMQVGATSMGASVLCEKNGKGIVAIDEERLIKENYGIPGTTPEIRQNIQAYVNSLADTLNYK
ncbi:DUF221-domain-containing protein [Backusella circina FSU 941]|nr:DUF221-domain-containing protein [Backusella circina FSU 941]